ncbi:hypothetical protein NQ318_008451 [Aromia moschata]|uniref:RRP15-like protein n=1 Tax=Aromia moschata TaxID=1265417 RepID=A0AAV8YAB0_9CUCU|nr:hypothetical protein NQ318_008451 [Aromia moschata]
MSIMTERKPKSFGFEVQTDDGIVKEEKVDEDDKISSLVLNGPPTKKRRDLPNLRVKPNILERTRERTLQKIATKGVVQLFNAVKIQQKEVDDKLKEAGPLEAKKEKVMKNLDKRAFLDVLMGEKSQKVDDEVSLHKMEQRKGKLEKDVTWGVLKDDFMMTAKMKDWDKDLEIDDEES